MLPRIIAAVPAQLGCRTCTLARKRLEHPTLASLVIGNYSDFASRVVCDEEDGKVRNLSGKLGYRQFFVYGTHAEVSVKLGWRNETERPDGQSYDAFHARLWALAD